jgi:Phosphoserine phosphatase RsbU, N-terminal domain
MTPGDDFQSRYATALLTHLTELDEASPAVGYELGRQALVEQVSMLEIIENRFRLVDELASDGPHDGSAALQLLQTGSVAYETPIRHRDGHLAWVAISVNVVTEDGADDRRRLV